MPLSLLYAYAGRFADARAALLRGRSMYNEIGARIEWALGGIAAGQIELIAGDPAAAERYLSEAYEVFRATGERRYLLSAASPLAEALYAQGRLDEAQRLGGRDGCGKLVTAAQARPAAAAVTATTAANGQRLLMTWVTRR